MVVVVAVGRGVVVSAVFVVGAGTLSVAPLFVSFASTHAGQSGCPAQSLLSTHSQSPLDAISVSVNSGLNSLTFFAVDGSA